MKRLTLEATDENVLETIKNNTLCRNDDVKEFIETLDSIEGNMFISLDANWGEGKTFFVRQIQKTLEYVTKRDWEAGGKEAVEKLEIYFKGTSLNKVALDKSYFPIYYNAWLYDNHDDPLLSLVLTIVKETEGYLDTKLDKSIGERVIDLINGFSVSFGKVQVMPITIATGTDLLSSVKTSEQIREMIKTILDNVITEKAERLIIFLDELDRCRPSFAIEMLERIKHYFDDERILFVISVNKEQLVHTISKCYGDQFNSSAYLNKFFDINTHMPIVKKNNLLFGWDDLEDMYLMEITEELNAHFKLSLRDSIMFKQRMKNIDFGQINRFDAYACCLYIFISIILVLDITNQEEKRKFLNGQSDLLSVLINEVPVIMDMFCSASDSRGIKRDDLNEGIAKIEATYKWVFQDMKDTPANCLPVRRGLKQKCIQISNSIRKENSSLNN